MRSETGGPRGALSPTTAVLLVGITLGLLARGVPGDPPGTETVRARRFEVVDAEGRARGAFYVDEGGPRVMLYDLKGRHRLTLALHRNEAPGLEVFTADGTHAVQLRHMNGEPVVSLHDAQGVARIKLKVSGEPATASVALLAADGTVETSLPPNPPRSPKSPK